MRHWTERQCLNTNITPINIRKVWISKATPLLTKCRCSSFVCDSVVLHRRSLYWHLSNGVLGLRNSLVFPLVNRMMLQATVVQDLQQSKMRSTIAFDSAHHCRFPSSYDHSNAFGADNANYQNLPVHAATFRLTSRTPGTLLFVTLSCANPPRNTDCRPRNMTKHICLQY